MIPTDLAKEALKLAGKIPKGPWMFSPGDRFDHWELWNDEESIVQDDSGVEPAKEVLEWFALSRTALPALAKAYLELDERCRLAEGVCEVAAGIPEYMNADKRCRLSCFDQLRAVYQAWRSHVTAKKEG